MVGRQTGLEKTSLRANQRRLVDRKLERHTADLRPIGLGVCPSATHIVFCKLALIHVACFVVVNSPPMHAPSHPLSIISIAVVIQALANDGAEAVHASAMSLVLVPFTAVDVAVEPALDT
jgi:hypothetical protein